MFSKRVIAGFLIASFLVPSLAIPMSARAEVGTLANCTGLLTAIAAAIDAENAWSVPEVEGGQRGATSCFNGIAYLLAKLALAYMTRSVVNWINSGFQGDPTFVSNPGKFFGDIANETSGAFIKQLGFEGLCDPIRPQIQLALAQLQEPSRFKCTLLDVIDNFSAFQKDFSKGGWAGWFQLTQYPQNNPYGLFAITLDAQNQLINKQLNLKSQELNQGQGFLSLRRCKTYDQYYELDPSTYDQTIKEFGATASNDGGIKGCQEAEVTTPGKMIVEAGVKVTGSPVDQLNLADSMNESLAAVFNALINQMISNGLRSLSDKKSSNTWFDSAADSVGSVTSALEDAVVKLQIVVNNKTASIDIAKDISARIDALLSECTAYLETNYPYTDNPLNPQSLQRRKTELSTAVNAYSTELAGYQSTLTKVGNLLSQAQETTATTKDPSAIPLPDLTSIFNQFQALLPLLPTDNVVQGTENDLTALMDELKNVGVVYASCKEELAKQQPTPPTP